MTNEDIIRMAREAGLRRHQENLMSNPPQIRFFYEGYEESIERFANLVAAHERNRTWTQNHWTEYERSIVATEREACIKLLEDFSKTTMVPVVDTWRMGLVAGVLALRGRGQE